MPSIKPPDPSEVRDKLFKEDRPRPIDRYIDFFGTGDRDPERGTHAFEDRRER
jgi:hypothetical protein